MHLSTPMLAFALGVTLTLSACDRPSTIVTPPPAVVVTGTPGPAGPAGEAGAQGKPGADAAVIVVQPSASAPAK